MTEIGTHLFDVVVGLSEVKDAIQNSTKELTEAIPGTSMIAETLEGLLVTMNSIDSSLNDKLMSISSSIDDVGSAINKLVKHQMRSRRDPGSEVPLTREAAAKKMFGNATKRNRTFRRSTEVKRLRCMEDVDALVEKKWNALSADNKNTWKQRAMWAAYDANDSD